MQKSTRLLGACTALALSVALVAASPSPAFAAPVPNPCAFTITALTGEPGSVMFLVTYDPATGRLTASDIAKADLPEKSEDWGMAVSQHGPWLSIGSSADGTAPDVTWDTSFANVDGSYDVFATISVLSADGSWVGSLQPMDPDTCQVTQAGASYHPVSPTRLLDSRTSTGGWNGRLVAGSPRTLLVSGGATGVPADAAAVVLNVTVTEGDANSFLTAYPAGTPVPTASIINAAAGATVPDLVTVKVGTAGRVAFANAVGSTDVVADLVGYYREDAGSRFTPVDPERILDSRTATGDWNGRLVAGAPRSLAVAGVNGVPPTATAAVLNVTATNADHNGFLTAFPTGESVPTASNLNFAAGQTVANLVTTRLGTDGKVSFAAAGASTGTSLDLVADLVGYFDPNSGAYFHVVNPVRMLDTRDGTGGSSRPVSPGYRGFVRLGGEAGVPHLARAVVGTTTVTEGTESSFLEVFSARPFNRSDPTTSNLNFAAGETVANSTFSALGSSAAFAGGQGTIGIVFRNAAGSTHVVFDLVGYFAAT